MERWNLFLNFSTNRKHVIAPMHVVVPLSTLGAMLITIIYKSAFSMMKVHKSTCLFIPSKITLITITYLPMFIRLVFFLNKGFLQYNRVAKTVKLRILYSIVYEGIAKGNKLSPLNDDVSTLLWIGKGFYFRYIYIYV